MTVDRRTACLAQATACRVKAEADPANRDYWVNESIKWLERAIDRDIRLVVTLEVDDGSPSLPMQSDAT